MFAAFYAAMLAENARFRLREAEARREAQQYAKFPDALYQSALPWLVAFGALENEEVRRNVIAGLCGAIVGAPADPEAFG